MMVSLHLSASLTYDFPGRRYLGNVMKYIRVLHRVAAG